MQRTKGKKKKL